MVYTAVAVVVVRMFVEPQIFWEIAMKLRYLSNETCLPVRSLTDRPTTLKGKAEGDETF